MIDSVPPSRFVGATRTAIVDFLDRADVIPPTERVAVFDTDGRDTLGLILDIPS